MAIDAESEKLLLDPFKKMGESFSQLSMTFRKATNPVVAAQSRLESLGKSLSDFKSQQDREYAERYAMHQENLAQLKGDADARSKAEANFIESEKELSDVNKRKIESLEELIKAEERNKTVLETSSRTTGTFGGGVDRAGAGLESMSQGLKKLSFGLIDLSQQGGPIKEFIGGLKDMTVGVISTAAGISEMIQGLILFSVAKKAGTIGDLKEAFTFIKDKVKGAAKGIGNALLSPFKGIANSVTSFTSGLFGKKKVTKDKDGKERLRGEDGKFAPLENVKMFAVKMGQNLRKGLGSIFGKKGILMKAFGLMKGAAMTFLKGAANFVKTAALFLASALASLASFLVLNAPIIALAAGIIALGVLIYMWYKKNEETIKPIFEQIIQTFQDIYDFIKPVVEALWEGTKRVFGYLGELFTWDEGDTVFSKLIDIVMAPLNMAINFVMGIFGWGDPDEPFSFLEWLKGIASRAWNWVKGIFGFGEDEMGERQGFIAWLGGIAGRAWDWVKSKFGFSSEKMQANAERMNEMVQGAWNKVQEWWKSATDKLKNAWESTKNWVGDKAGAAWDFITGKEDGGQVSGGETYMVGEAGPELFTPNANGKIIPNDSLGFTSASVIKDMFDQVMGGKKEGGSGGIVQTVMSSDSTMTTNNSYSVSSKTTRNNEASFGRTAVPQTALGTAL